MEVDREQLKLNILYRQIVSRGVYSGIPLTDDDGMDGIFDLFDADPTFCSELFTETEEIPQVPVTNNLGLFGIEPMMSLMHSTMDDQSLQSNARSLFEHPWSFEFYNPTCSFSMSNSMPSNQSIGAQCNRDTITGEGPSTMQYQHMEKGLIHEGLTDDNDNSDS
ncbi:hypothetical protein ACH5RR_012866 [Cinchona calisaya]|uniref:Uncharacterized protein n=1 Tax=Cinchona calisaya TaxID=153742 RepID=A0ABD3ACL9_9GENT